MNKILLASHGYLAQGMKSSLEILMGTNDRIECLCAYVDDDSRDVAALIDAWMETRDPADSWFVVTDIFGGSVNNEFIQRQTDGSFTLIAGMNLPLLVEMVTQLDSLDANKAKAAVEGSRSFIQLCEVADMLARPNGVKLVIKDVDAAIEALNSGVTDKYSLFIITETIEDVYRLAKGCKDIKEINLGGTRKAPETTLHPTPAIFATEKDAEHIQELLGDGVAIEIRQVPNDAKVFAKDVF